MVSGTSLLSASPTPAGLGFGAGKEHNAEERALERAQKEREAALRKRILDLKQSCDSFLGLSGEKLQVPFVVHLYSSPTIIDCRALSYSLLAPTRMQSFIRSPDFSRLLQPVDLVLPVPPSVLSENAPSRSSASVARSAETVTHTASLRLPTSDTKLTL